MRDGDVIMMNSSSAPCMGLF